MLAYALEVLRVEIVRDAYFYPPPTVEPGTTFTLMVEFFNP